MEAFLFFVYTLFSAVQQGIITWLFREFVPMKYIEWIDAALHKGGALIYAVIVSYILWKTNFTHWFSLIVVAFLIRIVIFDPALNLSKWWFSKREGRGEVYTPFSIGTSATSDKLTIRIADWIGISQTCARVIIWILASVLAIVLYWVAPPY